MKMGRFAFLGVVALLLATGVAFTDEGMWVYNSLPIKKIEEKYHFTVTDAWSSAVMKASVRFNSGGSGSFVSADGLVITNHHVAFDTIEKLSTSEKKNYLRDGFYAKTLEEELKAPDLELNQLQSIEDVTAKVEAAVTPEMSAEQAAAARKSAIAGIEKESFETTGLKSDVVTLYQGGQYHLYRYRKFTDVRLVFAPESAIAFFGGDADNFEFPRYDLDVTFFRVYENGKPAKIENYFPWSKDGAKAGELVFVSGHPGRTSRMFTADTLRYLRDVQIPYVKGLLNRREVMLQQFSVRGKEEARQAKGDLFSIQNSRKVYDGRIRGLQDSRLILEKERSETALRGQLASDPELVAFGGAWENIEKTLKAHKKILIPFSLLETGHAFQSKLFQIARTLVRLADENPKPNDERLAEYRDSNRESLEQQLFSNAPIYPEFEKAKLADSLEFLVIQLGQNHSIVKKVLQGKDPLTRAAELVDDTVLLNVESRKYFAKEGKKALATSQDRMLELAKLIDGAARNLRHTYESTVEEPQRQAYAQIAKVLFKLKGTDQYPDATFTLRLSYGEVKGYEHQGKMIDPFTTLGGAFSHAEQHEGQADYALPKSWIAAKDRLNPSTPFNFVSTNDTIGGNSGSPVINKNKEFVGIIFDSNIHSFTGDYQYSGAKKRAISVASQAILETLREVYGANSLVAELTK